MRCFVPCCLVLLALLTGCRDIAPYASADAGPSDVAPADSSQLDSASPIDTVSPPAEASTTDDVGVPRLDVPSKDLPTPAPDVCSPMPEICNGLDDNCNSLTDEGTLCPGEQCCGGAGCVPLNSLKYCGSCSNACDTQVADVCVNGDCRCGGAAACPSKATDCYQSRCVSGSCALVPLYSGAPCTNGICDDNRKCCTTCIAGSGSCAASLSNAACGTGGELCKACTSGKTCQNGGCS